MHASEAHSSSLGWHSWPHRSHVPESSRIVPWPVSAAVTGIFALLLRVPVCVDWSAFWERGGERRGEEGRRGESFAAAPTTPTRRAESVRFVALRNIARARLSERHAQHGWHTRRGTTAPLRHGSLTATPHHVRLCYLRLLPRRERRGGGQRGEEAKRKVPLSSTRAFSKKNENAHSSFSLTSLAPRCVSVSPLSPDVCATRPTPACKACLCVCVCEERRESQGLCVQQQMVQAGTQSCYCCSSCVSCFFAWGSTAYYKLLLESGLVINYQRF